jgi:hypothetical protein
LLQLHLPLDADSNLFDTFLLLLQRENLADPDNYTLAATGRLQLSDSTVLRATLQVRARKEGTHADVLCCDSLDVSALLACDSGQALL